jgi:hypothetical protein
MLCIAFVTKQSYSHKFALFMNKIFTCILFIFWSSSISAQSYFDSMPKIPQMRQLFHDDIIKTQQKIIGSNCTVDSIYKASDNDEVNIQITTILKKSVYTLRYKIEAHELINEGAKFTWLRAVNDFLNSYLIQVKFKSIPTTELGNIIVTFDSCMEAQLSNKSIASFIENQSLEVGNFITSLPAFKNNIGVDEAKNILLYKYCIKNPKQVLNVLSKHPNLPQAKELIIDFAKNNPQELYNFAAAQNNLGNLIRSIDDPMVKTVSAMATSNQGRFLFPFLDDVLNGKSTLNDLLKLVDNEEAFYKHLVKTELNYEVLKQQGNKPLAMDVLGDKLKAKAVEIYINEINALHDENNAQIRFAKIKNLTIEELYFLAVLGEEEIYTSSFISGVYTKMIDQFTTQKIKTDSLFRLVHYDRYRKFIKMCSGFNTLDDFLKRMDKPVAENLMRSFVNGLENTGSIEDAVDVADSYASIKDSSIKKIINTQVAFNLQQQQNLKNKKGIVIYSLLQQLFTMYDSSGKVDVAKTLNITNVYQLTVADVKNNEGKIYAQQFFYGDKDGEGAFNNFVNTFRGFGWRITSKEYWVEVSSNSGNPITIFANRPLDETKGLDDLAQQNLNYYLDSLNILPTIIVHRGHSYYVKSSIKQITSSAKLILLGSCGGYHSLSQVLNICPKAHIIASKQVGTGVVNMALIENIFETLKQNKDLVWQQVWKTMEQKFAKQTEAKERFDDYIPPHKNLGAIFIMAYYKALE